MKEFQTAEGTERRTVYYIRVETAKEIRITWRPIPLYLFYVWMLLYILFGYLSNSTADLDLSAAFALIGGISLLAFFVYSFVMFIRTRRVSREIKSAMRGGCVELTGNKWSLSDPQTVIIKKDAIPN